MKEIYDNSLLIAAVMVANYMFNVNYIYSILTFYLYGIFTIYVTIYHPTLNEHLN